jgi:type VI protein secretion system component VasK
MDTLAQIVGFIVLIIIVGALKPKLIWPYLMIMGSIAACFFAFGLWIDVKSFIEHPSLMNTIVIIVIAIGLFLEIYGTYSSYVARNNLKKWMAENGMTDRANNISTLSDQERKQFGEWLSQKNHPIQ